MYPPAYRNFASMLFDMGFISGKFFSVDQNVMKTFGLLETVK
jgi:hypothetical protein